MGLKPKHNAQGVGFLALGSLHNFILFVCYANQYHALNETDMSSSIWN